jgi:hypothetical protein
MHHCLKSSLLNFNKNPSSQPCAHQATPHERISVPTQIEFQSPKIGLHFAIQSPHWSQIEPIENAFSKSPIQTAILSSGEELRLGMRERRIGVRLPAMLYAKAYVTGKFSIREK